MQESKQEVTNIVHFSQNSTKFIQLPHRANNKDPGQGPRLQNFFPAQLSMKFSPLIDNTIVGIFIFIGIETFILSYVQQEGICNCL